MALGDLLGPSAGPRSVPQPSRTTDVTGAPVQGESEGKLKGLLKNPAVLSFMMNFATSLLAQQGIAQALGGGAAGVGRFANAEQDRITSEELEQRRRFESDREFALRQQAAARGRGGGGGSDGTKSMKEFNKLRAEHLEELVDYYEGDLYDGDPPSYEQMQGEATLLTMRDLGMGDMYQRYTNIEDPMDKIAFASVFASGPEAGIQLVTQYDKARKTAEESAAVETPPVASPSVVAPPNSTIVQPPSPRSTSRPPTQNPNPLQTPGPVIPPDPTHAPFNSPFIGKPSLADELTNLENLIKSMK